MTVIRIAALALLAVGWFLIYRAKEPPQAYAGFAVMGAGFLGCIVWLIVHLVRA